MHNGLYTRMVWRPTSSVVRWTKHVAEHKKSNNTQSRWRKNHFIYQKRTNSHIGMSSLSVSFKLFHKTSFCTRDVTKKLDTRAPHTTLRRAGRRRTGSLVPFRSKLLSHGDGKAMSRLYNAHTHRRARHPMHKHHAELPSSLNKRTPTPTRANSVYPQFRRQNETRISTIHLSARVWERSQYRNRCISFHAGKYWKCWCVRMRRYTNLAYAKPATREWDRNCSSHPLYIPSWYRSAAVPFDRSSGRWSFQGCHLILNLCYSLLKQIYK